MAHDLAAHDVLSSWKISTFEYIGRRLCPRGKVDQTRLRSTLRYSEVVSWSTNIAAWLQWGFPTCGWVASSPQKFTNGHAAAFLMTECAPAAVETVAGQRGTWSSHGGTTTWVAQNQRDVPRHGDLPRSNETHLWEVLSSKVIKLPKTDLAYLESKLSQ